ncbi:MAG TPA: VWA domain-containing protein [Pyrinomonadaceae bacterium]|nr:VWA domain-containing protein [Pyrinomonadaceae bacterium]
MLRHKSIARVLALALAASFLLAGGGGAWAGAQQQSGQPQQPAPKPQRPDETIDDDDVERVESDLTNVLFTAIDKGKRFVTTIKQEDIRILEDGQPQQIFTFQRETDRPLSLAILIDTSASQERTLPEEKSAAQRFVDTVIRPQKDEVAVLTFTGESTLEQGLTGNVARVRRAIDRVEFIPPSGYIGGGVLVGTPPISGDNQMRAASTAIWDAIWVTSREVLSTTSDKTRRAIILLTDGVDTSSRLKMSEAVDAALKADAIVYAIGIGDSFSFDGVDEGSVRKIAERTGGRAYFPRNEDDLRVAFGQIQDELRSQYLIAYSPSNKAKDGTFRKVQIEVMNPELRKQNLRLTYRQGYFARSAVEAKPKR